MRIEGIMRADSRESLVRRTIEIFAAIYVSDEFSLLSKEKRFFLHCILAYHDGVDLGSKTFLTYMQKTAKFSNSRQYIIGLRSKVAKKKWLLTTKDGYDIPSVFKRDIDKLYINVNIENNINNGTAT